VYRAFLIKNHLSRSRKEVVRSISRADLVGTSVLSRVEMASALTKATRLGWIEADEAETAWGDFLAHWPSYTRLSATTVVVERASTLPWAHILRGCDAMHLAAALSWGDAMESTITLATFDRELWQAGQKQGLDVWPEGLI
jgi:predicted nucleic acid-binding protein